MSRGIEDDSAGRLAEGPLDLDTVRIDPRLARLLPESLTVRRGVLLFGRKGDELLLACRSVTDRSAIETAERVATALRPTALRIRAIPAAPESLERAIARVFVRMPEGRRSDSAAPFTDERTSSDPIVLVERLLADAIAERASDIHVQPGRDQCSVRIRVDGELEERDPIPHDLAAGLLNRVKVLAELDIAERRLPQDGRFSWQPRGRGDATSGEPIDVRVAILPVRHGERITLRLLSPNSAALTLRSIGMSERDAEIFHREIERPHGMVLLTGPTGSGKTTTLYAALRSIDIAHRNVITIEDPVEYAIPGVSQTEIDPEHGVAFASALRAVLRHDPDVILVGEIRDGETADTAVKASLTGHLLLSTLHTNSAASSITRLVDMGVPRYLVAATGRLFVAQRLVRRLCRHCSEPAPVDRAQALALGDPTLEGTTAFVGAGCGFCRGSGYSGRIGLFELLRVDGDLMSRIVAGVTEAELRVQASSLGQRSLRDDALDKVRSGMTSLSEVLRNLDPV